MLQHGAAQVSRWCDLAIVHLKIVPNYAKNLAILCYHIRKKIRHMLNSSNSQAEYEDLHGIQGEIFMNIPTASNLNSRSSCLKHFDAEETGAQDLWSGAKCWMLGHWGLAILPRERVQPVTNHAMEPIWQRSRARGHQSRRQSFKCCRVKSLNVRLCGQKVQASSGTMSKRVKTSLHKQLV